MKQSRVNPELRALVSEATQALARLDPDRLDELALSCRALNRDGALRNTKECVALAREAREAASDMAVFARVLEVTRANLQVMERLRNLHQGRQGYEVGPGTQRTRTKGQHGDN